MSVDTESATGTGNDAPGRSPWKQECNIVSTWAKLAVDVYAHGHDCADGNQNGLHLFATSVSRTFEMMRRRIAVNLPPFDQDVEPSGSVIVLELLVRMADVLRWSLAHSRPDCGAFTSLPWIGDILDCYTAAAEQAHFRNDPLGAVPFMGDQTLRPTFLLVLRLLHTSLKRGLPTGETASAEFDQLATLLGHPWLPELQANGQDVLSSEEPDTDIEGRVESLDQVSIVRMLITGISSEALIEKFYRISRKSWLEK